MKKAGILSTVFVTALFVSCNSNTTETASAIFPKGTRITNDNFTGTGWLQELVNSDTTYNTSVGHVTFELGARARWHYHPGGQILLVISGKGRYQEQGQHVRELMEGEVVKCAPNIVHWHGTAPNNQFSHVAIGTNTRKGVVVWLQRVSDEEYNNFHP